MIIHRDIKSKGIEKKMKKLFTVDDFAVAFVAALGYGFGETISRLLGWPPFACGLASLVLGMVLEIIISKIAFSETVQKSPRNRILTYAAFCLVFLIAHTVSFLSAGVSMVNYLTEHFAYIVVLPLLGFGINLLIRAYQIRKIRSLYGDGSEGFVFDVAKEDVEEINRQNQPVSGEYDPECAVKTETGVYVGEKNKQTVSWCGIPYAIPPVGDRRWKAPEPLPPSDTVFEAKCFGASAIQVDHKGSILKLHRQSEDCLTLNIWTGADKAESPKPVLVLFHHGGFTCGGSADPLLYGSEFADQHPDIVFVSFNYRLGLFGFIDFSEVPGGEAYPDAVNLGLLDQIAALEWIRDNIAAFGGDPGRVTVLGFEAGAASVCLLSACKRAKGLFRKAFALNGSPASAWETPEQAKALAQALLKETRTSTMEELSHLSTEALKDASQKLWRDMCGPTCDGTLIPADVFQAWQNGTASDIGIIIGIPGNEMQVYRSFVGDQNYTEELSAAVTDLQNSVDDSAAGALRAYTETQAASGSGLEAKSKLVEQCLAVSLYRSAEILAEGGNQVRLIYWNEKPLIGNLGSGTVDAAAVLLGNREALQLYGNVMNTDLSETLQLLLAKFIHGEDLQLYPNEIKGIDALTWRAFPLALIVSDGKVQCGPIEDLLPEIGSLPDFIESKK